MEKILFELVVTDDYPPVRIESLWAEKDNNGFFRIKNIPFYSKEVSYDDLVITEQKEGNLFFKKVKKSSQNSTIRIIFYDASIDKKNILDNLVSFGCDYEEFSSQFIALNIPIEVNIEIVLNYLNHLHGNDILDFEYGKMEQ